MVNDHPTTTRLASIAVGDLRAGRACVDLTRACIAVALQRDDASLGSIPPGQLIELSNSVAALEAAADLVLRHVDPDAAQFMSSVAELCRESPPTSR